MPLLLPTSSANTIRMSDSDRLSRNPANALGSAAGTMTQASRCRAESWNASPVSRNAGSTVAAPSMVFSRIGHSVPNAMVATSISVPILNRTMKTGAIVTTGSARANCSSGFR
jgi:hypothetical protein